MDSRSSTDGLPLGKRTDYPDTYSPGLLYPIARAESREALGIAAPLPFSGVDIWNAWELTWLSANGQPVVATAEIRIPADSTSIIESKSLKLYLNSFSMSRQVSAESVRATLREDLGRATDADVAVSVLPAADVDDARIDTLPGECLDLLDVACDTWSVDPGLLAIRSDRHTEVSLYSHALRSLCPVTHQPDTGSVLIQYKGPEIDRESLLRYVVSYRRHEDFHEACVERMYLDILKRCSPERLVVHGCYQRRGGIDINPYRGSTAAIPNNLRLWRQ